ncbi:hypothetical protein DFP73DRAFT_544201 [Morchella snyderi]|nr:hypothetical protein DFP73DRAFT_544201 [Morchella snyderi]
MSPLPAHETKHEPLLHYPVLPTPLVLDLTQSDTTQTTTGSTLWLGAQVLAVYLLELYGTGSKPLRNTKRLRAIDLGAGVGLTANVLAMLGFEVVATDLRVVVDAVLAGNVRANEERVRTWGGGGVAVRELDWFVVPEEWNWGGDVSIAPPRDTATNTNGISPCFDVVVTADTLYVKELVAPLVRTMKALSVTSKKGRRCPPVFVALERRDPEVIEYALDLAKKEGFDCRRIPDARLTNCLESSGVKWEKEDWDGVEIWKWILKV